MKSFKRAWLFVIEACVLVFGLVLTVGLSGYFESFGGLILGIALTGCSLFAIRTKNSEWKIEYEASRWLSDRSRQRLHPNRAKRSRIARTWLLWFPSACAAVVVLFYPFASHIQYAGKLKPYRVPIPWT